MVVAETSGSNTLTYQGLFSGSEKAGSPFNARRRAPVDLVRSPGRRLAAAAAPADYNAVCLTGDAKNAVYDLGDLVTGSIDVWALDLASARPSRLPFNPSTDFYPVCSRSGDNVIFASLRECPPNLFRVSLAAPGSERSVLRSPVPKIATDWSRDGKLLVYTAINPKTNSDVEVVPLAGGRPWVVAATVAEESNARLSPDGRWIAYNSNESGGFEVYVQPFPPTGVKWQVSKGGGQQAQWRHDGAELFYITPDRKRPASSSRPVPISSSARRGWRWNAHHGLGPIELWNQLCRGRRRTAFPHQYRIRRRPSDHARAQLAGRGRQTSAVISRG